MKVTVLGGSGFIGSHLVRRLQHLGVAHEAPSRTTDLGGRHLGVVVYCIGVTADFRTRPFDTVSAHVSRLADLMTSASFDALVYVSSTRLYRRCSSPATEEALVPLSSADPDDLYDISKLMGEAVSFAGGREARVVRLSNVYGTDLSSPNFLSSVIREALADGHVVLHTSLDSWKDYVSIDDVTDVVLRVAMEGSHRLYNVASGANLTHRELVGRMAELTGCSVSVAPDSPTLRPSRISIQRIQDEFGYQPTPLLDDLPGLVSAYRRGVPA